MAGYEILLLDDGSEVFTRLSWTLKRAGYKVTATETGEPVINRRNIDYFDLLITRASNGSSDFMEIVKNFKKFNPRTQVILLSGDYERVFPLAAYEMAVDDYIFMPCAFGELRRRLSACLAGLKLQRLQELSGINSALINRSLLNRLLSKSRTLNRTFSSDMRPPGPVSCSNLKWN
ncbi:MAG: response regulator [Thermodesulfobacteriota bacterium]